jgi:OOP family OmpA-OmpF porin
VEGHTDSVGTDEYNQGLSEKSAQAVRDYLVKQGVSGQFH